jgi:hypothetical protein
MGYKVFSGEQPALFSKFKNWHGLPAKYLLIHLLKCRLPIGRPYATKYAELTDFML